MRILKGTYTLKARELHLSVPVTLDLGASPTCLYLSGDNGVGKTSFIEHVLIPGLSDQNIPYLYLGQDLRTQLYTIKAALAVTGRQGPHQGMSAVVAQWVAQNRQARVLILDEFDKYPDDTQHVFNISRDYIRVYVLVSHGERPVGPEGRFAVRTLGFSAVESAPDVRRVEIREVSAW